MSLKNKKVVVIGGTSGIGLAIAQAAALQGAELAVASSSSNKVEEAKTSLQGQVEGYVLDVSNEQNVEKFFQTIGNFDHLVTSVGRISFKPFLEESVTEARKRFEIIFWGQFTVARYGAPYTNPGGSITLTSGKAAHKAVPGFAPIGTASAAIESLCRYLALELAPVRVNAVCPGVTATPIFNTVPNSDDALKSISDELPLQRVGKPEEIAQAYLYLMQNEFSTGSVVLCDGGEMIL
jgi:NAD(P)-dependent dehydrogenase (short-subunit alcohol dehydrogenase family)